MQKSLATRLSPSHLMACTAFCLALPLHAQTPVSPAKPELLVKKGQYIRDTAEQVYGNNDFDGLIILYNRLASGQATYSADQLVKLPPVGQIFREAKMDPAYLEVIDEMIAVATEYQRVSREFFETAGKHGLKDLQLKDKPGFIRVPVAPATLAKAAELERRLAAARSKLAANLKHGHAAPNAFLRNLDGASGYLKTVATGVVDENCYDVDMVSQRLGHAFSNALIWTRENYR